MTTFLDFATSATSASIGDPDGTRTVTSIIVLLVAIGLALVLLAVWIYRTTRPDPELLAPLEAMGKRSWRRGDPVWQRRHLDELRPRGAKPLAPSVAPPELDSSFDAGPTAPGFDDLRPSDRSPGGPDEDGDGDGGDDSDEAEGAPVTAADATPAAAVAPTLDELADDEFDPDALAAARAALERELGDPQP